MSSRAESGQAHSNLNIHRRINIAQGPKVGTDTDDRCDENGYLPELGVADTATDDPLARRSKATQTQS